MKIVSPLTEVGALTATGTVTVAGPVGTNGQLVVKPPTTGSALMSLASVDSTASIELAGNNNVVGTAGFLLRQDTVNRAILTNRANADMLFTTNNVVRMTITAAGAIAFGTSNSLVGTAGQVLTSAGSAAAPTWATPTAYTADEATLHLVGSQFSVMAGFVANETHTASSKATPIDGDELPLTNSAGSFGLKKLTWLNLKATLKTYLDTLYAAGTVTTVSVATANGVSGSVATATTTPAITLTLGAITPSSVVASGTVAATGLLTADATLTPISINRAGVANTPRVQNAGTTPGPASSLLSYFSSSATNGAILAFAKSLHATVGSHTLVTASTILGTVSFTGSDGVAFQEGCRIVGQIDGTPALNSMPSRIVFMTAPNASVTPVEVMRISAAGALGFAGANYGGAGDMLVSGGATATPVWSDVITPTSVVVNAATAVPTRLGAVALTAQLQVHGITAATSSDFNARWDNTGSGAGLFFGKSRGGGVGTHGAVAANDVLGYLSMAGSDGTNFVEGVRIQALVDGTPSADVTPGRIVFSTASTTNTPVERLRLSSVGALGIGGANYGNAGDLLTSGGSSAAPTWSPLGAITPTSVAVGSTTLIVTRSAAVPIAPTLQVHGLTVGSSSTFNARWTNDISGLGLFVGKSRGGAVGTHGAVANGDALGFSSFAGSDGTNFVESARIQVNVDGTPGADLTPGRIGFFTSSTTNSPVERFRIAATGALGIGGATYGSAGDVFTSGGSAAPPTWSTSLALSGTLSGSNLSGTNTGNETTTTQGALINSATSKSVPADADQLGLMDSAASNILKKWSIASVKSSLKGYFDTIYTRANFGEKVQILTDAATITLDASLGNGCRVVLGGNRTLANPTNMIDGQVLNIRVIQDATGSRTLAYGTKFRFPAGVAPVLSTVAGSRDLMTCQYDATDTTWCCSMQKAFA